MVQLSLRTLLRSQKAYLFGLIYWFRVDVYFLNFVPPGGVAEWSKAHAWKVCILQKSIGGSNPFPSAEQRRKPAQVTVRVSSFWPEPSFLERRGRMEKHGSSVATTGYLLCAEPFPLPGSRAQRVIPSPPQRKPPTTSCSGVFLIKNETNRKFQNNEYEAKHLFKIGFIP